MSSITFLSHVFSEKSSRLCNPPKENPLHRAYLRSEDYTNSHIDRQECGFYITHSESVFHPLHFCCPCFSPQPAGGRSLHARALLALASHPCNCWVLFPAAFPVSLSHEVLFIASECSYPLLSTKFVKGHYYESGFYCTQQLPVSILL